MFAKIKGALTFFMLREAGPLFGVLQCLIGDSCVHFWFVSVTGKFDPDGPCSWHRIHEYVTLHGERPCAVVVKVVNQSESY